MAMHTTNRDGEAMSDINTTPLIDVMLVLLTLLIITLPLQTHAVKIDLPRKAPLPPVVPPAVTLTVDFDGTTYWDGTAVNRTALDAHFARAAHQDPQPDIRIVANRLAPYDAVARVLVDASHEGATHVGFVGTQNY
jgi:biopolymer transport protein ExbD